MRGAVTGREYHYFHYLLSPYRGQPDIYSRMFFAHYGTEQAQTDNNSGICLLPVPADHGATANVAYAFWQKQWECT